MTYTWRVLPPEEWVKLAGTEAASVMHGFDPVNTHVMVVEHEGQIVGTWTLMRIVHAECLWIRADHRKRFAVAARLLRGLRLVANTMGVQTVWTNALSDDVRALLAKVHAIPVPGEAYMLPLGGSSCPPLS